MTFQLPDKDDFCHHTGFEKKCLALVAGGICKRWRFLPGVDVFSGLAREQWGCIDNLVLQLQGESNRQANGAHETVVQLREMVTNAEYRRAQIETNSEDQIKAIEAQS